MVREAYIHILYDSRQRRENFTVKIAYQAHVFFLQCDVTIALLLIKRQPRFKQLQVGTKEFFILAFSIKNISNRPLFWSFQ